MHQRKKMKTCYANKKKCFVQHWDKTVGSTSVPLAGMLNYEIMCENTRFSENSKVEYNISPKMHCKTEHISCTTCFKRIKLGFLFSVVAIATEHPKK